MSTLKAINIVKSLEKSFPQAKTYQRVCLLPTLFLPTLETNFFGNSSSSIERIKCSVKLIMNEHQQLTRNIRKPDNVGIFNFCSFIKIATV